MVKCYQAENIMRQLFHKLTLIETRNTRLLWKIWLSWSVNELHPGHSEMYSAWCSQSTAHLPSLWYFYNFVWYRSWLRHPVKLKLTLKVFQVCFIIFLFKTNVYKTIHNQFIRKETDQICRTWIVLHPILRDKFLSFTRSNWSQLKSFKIFYKHLLGLSSSPLSAFLKLYYDVISFLLFRWRRSVFSLPKIFTADFRSFSTKVDLLAAVFLGCSFLLNKLLFNNLQIFYLW